MLTIWTGVVVVITGLLRELRVNVNNMDRCRRHHWAITWVEG